MSPARAGLCALLLGAGVPACGGGGGGTPVTVVAVGVQVSFDRDVDPLPFDPRAARLRAASEQLNALAGHPIAFRFEAALLPQYQSTFESALIDAVENVAQDLRYLKENRKEAFEHGVPLLEHVECRYDATATEDDATFDAEKKTLTVKVHPNGWSLVQKGRVAGALDDELYAWLERSFGGAAPRSVAPADQARYFQFLTGYRPHGPRSKDLDRPESYQDDPRAIEILYAAELLRMTKDAGLAGKIRKWLVDHGDYFVSAYVRHPELVTQAGPSTAFHRAEAAWVAFVQENAARLSAEERKEITKTIFVRMWNDSEPKWGRFASFSFPGIDPMTWSLGIVDEWRKAGHPVELPEDRERGLLYEYVVCPHPKSENGNRSRAPRCDHSLYDYALATDRGRERLAEAILARRDPAFTEMAIVNVGYEGKIERLVETWRALEADEATWRVAARVIAEDFAYGGGDPLMDETRRLYRAYPARRGALLRLLAEMDRYGNGVVPWSELHTAFGAAVSAPDFAAYLDEGSRAFSLVSVIWPALAPGFSRAEPLVTHLDGFMDDPLVREYNFQDPWLALRNVVNRLCAEHRKEDLSLLHAAFAKRAERRPSEARPLANLLEDTGPSACR
ncbi:MAG TPA: hypothetical protein VHE30_27670 [Polyangiaceae bacterium]|nr:hypothetical protein [Polyangiaceae bacterium]